MKETQPERRLRVVRIISRLNVGGPARHVVWLTQALNNDEFDSVLVTGTVPHGEADMSRFAAEHGVRPVIIEDMSREISPRDIITVFKVLMLLRRYQPDIVHTHTAKAGFAGRIAGLGLRLLSKRWRRTRFVHTYHGHIFHSYYGSWKTRLFVAIERFLARTNTDRILVLSDQQLQEIHGTYGVGAREQFSIVPLGLDLGDVRADEQSGLALRRELGIPEEAVVVGIVGRLTPIKNHEMFLRLAATLGPRTEGLEVRYVIYGDGLERERLQALAVALGIERFTFFAGMRAAGEIYGSADIVVLTSRNEGTPLTLIEAMVNAKPVVSTRVGGVIDLVGPAEHIEEDYVVHARGLTVGAEDLDALARGVRRLVIDSSLRSRLGETSRSYAQNTYSKERLVTDIIGLYRELAGQSSGGEG